MKSSRAADPSLEDRAYSAAVIVVAIGRATAVAIGIAALACAADDARATWLRHTIVLDNQDMLERDPDLAAGKLAKMAESPFAFLRGTAAQFTRDLLGPDAPVGWQDSTLDRSTTDVALVGDAHPENFGTYRSGSGTLTLDFNDFDAATFGPFEIDVRRLAVGFWVACRQAGAELDVSGEAALADADCRAIAAAVADGYAAEIHTLAEDPNAATLPTEVDPGGAIARSLLENAREDGDAGQELAANTRVVDGRREMVLGDLAPARLVALGPYEQLVIENSLREPTAEQSALVEAIVPRWVATQLDPPATAPILLGAARRYGAGISSYPLLRFYVLLAGASDAPDADTLLEVKEVRDAVPLPGLPRPIDAPHASNGERVVALQRDLQAFADDDPWLGWADLGGQSFRVGELTGYQDGFEVAAIAPAIVAGDWTADDLVEFAALAGHVLGRSHARARKQDGERALAAIDRALGDSTEFVATVSDFAVAYGGVVEDDHRRFRDLLAEQGPTLGYVR